MPPSTTARTLLELAVSASGVYAFFFAWGLLQERIATKHYLGRDGHEYLFHCPFLLGLVTSFVAVLMGSLAFRLERRLNPTVKSVFVSRRYQLLMGAGIAFGAPMSYVAMRHISYPLVLALKMCKMIPTAILGIVVYHHWPLPLKALGLSLTLVGVLSFLKLQSSHETSQKQQARASDALGVVLCFANLLIDALTNSTQDEVVRQTRNISPFELMRYAQQSAVLYDVAVLLLLASLSAPLGPFTNEIPLAFQIFSQSSEALRDVLLLGLTSALGQLFTFRLIRSFGSLTSIAVGITRKIGSIALSILIHGHSIQSSQLIALCGVISGILLDTVANVQLKNKEKRDS